jgi:hypothetical protein
MKELKNLINKTNELNAEVDHRYQMLNASKYMKKLLFTVSLLITYIMVSAQSTNTGNHTPDEAISRIVMVIGSILIGRAIYKSRQNKKKM